MLNWLRSLFRIKTSASVNQVTPEYIGVDVRYFPLFRGYVTILAVRYYVYIYACVFKQIWRNLSYGRVIYTLSTTFTYFIDALVTTNTHIIKYTLPYLEAYDFLVSSDYSNINLDGEHYEQF